LHQVKLVKKVSKQANPGILEDAVMHLPEFFLCHNKSLKTIVFPGKTICFHFVFDAKTICFQRKNNLFSTEKQFVFSANTICFQCENKMKTMPAMPARHSMEAAEWSC